MKKRLVLAAAGVALAAAVPVGSAFGGITDPAKCAAYTYQLARIDARIANTTNPGKVAILQVFRQNIVNKINTIPNC